MGLPDKRSAGRSRLVPYRRGESGGTRHARRRSANLAREREVRAWCRTKGLSLRITNGGHHWQFARDSFVAEWWPSSAKLVVNKQWDDGIHCHDHRQAIRIIEQAVAAVVTEAASKATAENLAKPSHGPTADDAGSPSFPRSETITDDMELEATLDRIRYFQEQVRQLRNVETDPANYRLRTSQLLAEIDRMQREARDYLRVLPSRFEADGCGDRPFSP